MRHPLPSQNKYDLHTFELGETRQYPEPKDKLRWAANTFGKNHDKRFLVSGQDGKVKVERYK